MNTRKARTKATIKSRRKREKKGERQWSRVLPAESFEYMQKLVARGYAENAREAVIKALELAVKEWL